MSGLSAGTAWVAVKPKPEGWSGLKKAVAIAAPLAAVGAVAFKVGDDFNQMRKTIIVGTAASGKALKGLEASAKRVGKSTPSNFKDVGTAIADVNTRMGLTGKPLETMSKKFLNLSRITGTDLAKNIEVTSRAFGDWGIAIKDQPKALDKIFATSQSTGIGLDKLQQQVVTFGAPMRQFGFSFDESISLMGKFEKEGVNANAIFAGMKVGLGAISKAGKDPQKEFARVTAAIKGAGSAGEANQIAIATFGQRAGPDLAAAVREGRFEIGDMVKALDKSGGSIDDADKRTRTWRESLQILRNKAMVYIKPLADGMFNSLTVGAAWVETRVIPTVKRLTGFVRDNSTAFKVAGVVIGSLVAGLVIYKTTVAVVAKVTKLWAIAQGLLNGALVLNPIGIVVVALVALGAALVVAYKKSDRFRAIVDKAWSVIKRSVKAAWDGYIKPALAAFSGFLTNRVGPAVKWLWDKVVKPYFQFVGAYVKFVWQKLIKPYLMLWWDFISNVLGPVVKWLWNKVVSPIFSAIGGHIKTVWRDNIKPVLKAFGDFIKEHVAPAFRKGVGIIGDVWDGIKEMAKKPVNFVIDTVYNNGIRKGFNSVAEFLGMKSRLPHMATIGGSSGGSKAKPHGSAPGGTVAGGGGGRPGTGKHAHPEDAMGGPFSFVKNLAGKGGKWLSNKMMGAVDGLLGKVGNNPFAQMIGSTAKQLALGATDFLGSKLNAKKKADKLAKGPGGKAGRVLPAGSYSIGMPYLGYNGHYGADYPAATGTPVSSPWAGTVSKAATITGSYGKHVYVEHGGGVQTRFAHLSAIGVRPGQMVGPGSFLGRVGSTGNSSGPHLHFEKRTNGVPSNPATLGLFDRGGQLAPGMLAYHSAQMRRPDKVLTDQQWSDMSRIAEGVERTGGGKREVHNHFPTVDAGAASAAARRTVTALDAVGV